MKKGIISILSILTGMAAGAGAVGKISGKKFDKMEKMSQKHLALFLMMNQWVQIKQHGKNLEKYFIEHNYKDIAIYGMSHAGERLLEELKDSSITVKYGIDKRADRIYTDIDIFLPEDSMEPVDAVIVTAISFMDEIEEELTSKITCPILSLEDILYEV